VAVLTRKQRSDGEDAAFAQERCYHPQAVSIKQQGAGTRMPHSNVKGYVMKKVFSAIAIMSLFAGQAFAQSAPAETPAPAPAPAPTPAVAAAPSAGLSVAAMVTIGVAVAAVAAVASDNGSSSTTHH
jgi:hypothetical protein